MLVVGMYSLCLYTYLHIPVYMNVSGDCRIIIGRCIFNMDVCTFYNFNTVWDGHPESKCPMCVKAFILFSVGFRGLNDNLILGVLPLTYGFTLLAFQNPVLEQLMVFF